MTMITVFIKAYGCIGDDYTGKETTQDYQLEKDLTDSQLTEKDVRVILESLITSIEQIKALYPDEQTEVLYHNHNRLESLKFEIVVEDKSGLSQTFEEKNFFEAAAKCSSLSHLILKYCDITDDGEEGLRISIMDEYGEGLPAGTHAILALVNEDKSWIPSYIEFLRTNDLDHEVEQMWDIKSIIEKYNWGKETCRLAIARNISCCGQGGNEQFNDFLNNGLSDYLNSNENRKEFLS